MTDIVDTFGEAIVLQGDALKLPLPDRSVNLIVTSPPYFGQRVYLDNGHAYTGQVGNEATPQEFLEVLWAFMKEAWRVLVDDGMVIVNLGDKRSGSGGANNSGISKAGGRGGPRTYTRKAFGRRRSKQLLPHRFAIGCEDGLADPDGIGWVMQQEIVWSKPNGIPDSTPDRSADTHEYWFMFTKLETGFYAAMDLLREQGGRNDAPRPLGTRNRTPRHVTATDNTGWKSHSVSNHPAGSSPKSVWEIPTEPLHVPDDLDFEEHYAAFPQEWPRRLILGWSPPGICEECDRGRFPVVEKVLTGQRIKHSPGRRDASELSSNERGMNGKAPYGSNSVSIVGYACDCTPFTLREGEGKRDHNEDTRRRGSGKTGWLPDDKTAMPKVKPWKEYHFDQWTPAPTRPAVVLDLFGGTGTTAMVARALGRIGISIDLSHSYCELARWRIFESGHWKKTLERTYDIKIPKTVDHPSLFDEAAS